MDRVKMAKVLLFFFTALFLTYTYIEALRSFGEVSSETQIIGDVCGVGFIFLGYLFAFSDTVLVRKKMGRLRFVSRVFWVTVAAVFIGPALCVMYTFNIEKLDSHFLNEFYDPAL